MYKIILDLEANFSVREEETGIIVASGENLNEQIAEYKKNNSVGKLKSDFAVAFNDLNRVVNIGVFDPQEHKYTEWWLGEDDISTLKDLVENKAKVIIGQNVKYDVHWLNKLGIKTSHLLQDDTLIREHRLRGGKANMSDLGLDKLAPKYGGTKKVDVIKPLWKKFINTSEIDRKIISHYLRTDVYNTWKVWLGQEKHPMRKQFDKLLKMNRRLNGTVQRMEYNGICVNKDVANEISDKFYGYMKEAEVALQDLIAKQVEPKTIVTIPSGLTAAKKEKWISQQDEDEVYIYDLNSGKRKMELMYGLRFKEEGEKIPTMVGKSKRYLYPAEYEWRNTYKKIRNQAELDRAVKKLFDVVTPSFKVRPIPHKDVLSASGFSCGKLAIEALKDSGRQTKKGQEFVDAIVNLNAKKTWYTTNIRPMRTERHKDGLIHANFNVAGTDSGRFSSSNPNMQNLPSKKKSGGMNDVRRCVESRWGDEGCIVAIDYSQLELRFVMEYTKCKQGIADYNEGVDMHSATARTVYDAKHGEGSFDKLSKEDFAYWRGEAKAVNFGLLYGARPKGETQEALSKAFFERYPEVSLWHQKLEDEILAKEYSLNTMTGWKYNYKGANRDNFWRGYNGDKGWRNKSRNAPIQGGSNEVIQVASIHVDEELLDEPEILLIGQVHDELLFDCKKTKLDKCYKIGYTHMEKELGKHYMLWFDYSLQTPFTVEGEAGDNWFNTDDIDKYKETLNVTNS